MEKYCIVTIGVTKWYLEILHIIKKESYIVMMNTLAGFCEYKGVQYNEGQSWDDGCSYTCTCIDSSTGQYQCQEK